VEVKVILDRIKVMQCSSAGGITSRPCPTTSGAIGYVIVDVNTDQLVGAEATSRSAHAFSEAGSSFSSNSVRLTREVRAPVENDLATTE
jgi:hypothetical protein